MKKTLNILLCVLLAVCLCATTVSAYSYNNANYNDRDVEAVQDIINSNSDLDLYFDVNNPEDWQIMPANWNGSDPKRLTYLSLLSYSLSGSIDVSELTELEYFYLNLNSPLSSINLRDCHNLVHFHGSAGIIRLPNKAVVITNPVNTSVELHKPDGAPSLTLYIRVSGAQPGEFDNWQIENVESYAATYDPLIGLAELEVDCSILNSNSTISCAMGGQIVESFSEVPAPAPTPAAAKSADGGMDMIYVDGTELAGFDRLVFNYTLDVPYEKTSVVFTGKMSHWGAWADNLWEIPLNVGANPVVIKTTAEDGKTNWFYTVTVNRAPEVVATPQPTAEPTPQPTEAPTPTPQPTAEATPTPAPQPTAEATPTPAPQPTAQPTQAESESGFPTAAVAVAAVIGAVVAFVAVKKIKGNNA